MFKAQIFQDLTVQKEFETKGFVRFPFLEDDKIKDLKDFYNQFPNVFEKGFHASMFNPESQYRKKADEKIRSVVQPRLESLLKGYITLYGNFMVKEPGEESAMKLHQDWTYVNEDECSSLAIWFPLQDLNEKNGVLQMVPGSHRMDNRVRGPGIFEPYLEQQEYLLDNCLESIYLKTGEAIIWDHRVLHCSPANLSTNPRISVTAILVPETAPVFHYYQSPEHDHNRIEKFEVNNEFYMNYEIGKRPNGGESLGFVEYEFPPLSLKKLKQILNIENPAASKGIFSKLKQLITN